MRAEALKAALGTASYHSFMKGFALHPFCDGGGVGNAPINCNLKSPNRNDSGIDHAMIFQTSFPSLALTSKVLTMSLQEVPIRTV